MIKEKHEKGPDTGSTTVKEEAANPDGVLNKSLESTETRIKTEDEATTSSCSKDNRNLTKNGANNVIGSTNTGSLHSLVDRKEPHLLDGPPEEGTVSSEDASSGMMVLKQEDGGNIEPGGKISQDAMCVLGMGGGGGTPGSGPPPTHQQQSVPPPPPDGVQPLASNVINKQSTGSVEVQYMQQQSQIFVFSTMLANKGAEAVYQGHFPSIIAYHCAQPGTKKYLEKNPLKVTQFNRQNPAQWLNNLAMMKNKGCTRSPGGGVMGKPGPPAPSGMEGFLGPDGLDDMVGLTDADLPWEQPPNPHLTGGPEINGGPMLSDVDPTSCHLRSSPGGTVPLGHSPVMTSASSASPSLASMQPSLQGVKVPDENLTPQQRQHREEQLATIRKMHQMLFPESNAMDQAAGGTDQPQDPAAQTQAPGAPNMENITGEPCSESGPTMPGGPQSMLSGPSIPPGGMMPRGPMGGPPAPGQPGMQQGVAAQLEWQKLQHQFFEERKVRGQIPPGSGSGPGIVPRAGTGGPGPRLQGPPPPYHQTPRSASVPIALQSPSPASPNNPTSNLSLPSPRASSALNSPADAGRSFGLSRHLSTGQSPTSQDSPSTSRGLIPSNPGTPISSHLSPNSGLMGSTPQDFPTTSGSTPTSTADGMFGRTLQSLAQQKQQTMSTSSGPSTSTSTNPSSKEPNLMPVPSPQQIQYLNTFEGQELTIQKQPNTSLKDGNMISPSMISTTIDSGFSAATTDITSRLSGPNTPMTPSSLDMAPRFPATPSVSEGCRFQMSSPQTSNNGNVPPSNTDKNQRVVGSSCLSPQGARTPGSAEMHKPEMGNQFPTSSPHGMMDVHRFPGPGPGGVCPTTSPGPFTPQQQPPSKMPGFMNISPSGKGPGGMDMPPSSNYGCVRSDNVPLNPNSGGGMTGGPKVSHFDPISSLAQMSQQLTNSVASSLNGQSAQAGGGMMGFGSPAMHMMDMGGCHGLPELDAGPGSCNMMGMPPMQPGGHPHGGYHQGPAGSPMGAPVRSLSPKMGGNPGPGPGGPFPPGPMPMPRMMGRAPGCNPYNGANVQVKPNAPNTIQYLPAKPQLGNSNPRGPPSLDFLRFPNPLSNLDSKMPTQNLQYFPGCGPNGGPMSGPVGGHMGHMDGGAGGPMGGDGPMLGGGGMMNGGVMNNGPAGMMGGGGGPPMGMGPGMGGPPMVGGMPPLMRGPGGMRPGPVMAGGMIRMQQMGPGPGPGGPAPGGFNGPGGPTNGGVIGGDPSMFPGGPMGGGPGQMFVSGPKQSPMGLGGTPDASQPLPPSMGQTGAGGGGFKNSPFVGPTTSDPNYAQQFHNFQQQLYATTTRSQMSSQAMGPGGPGPGPPGPPTHSATQPYFVPK